jgi:hypothetical protein
MDFVYSNAKVSEGLQAKSGRSQRENQVGRGFVGNGLGWFDDICLGKKEC